MLAHVCEKHHAWHMQGSPNLTSHLYTYVRDTCKFSSDFDALMVSIRGNPRLGIPQIYPYSILRMRVYQWSFFLVLVCLGHVYMESKGWAYFTIK